MVKSQKAVTGIDRGYFCTHEHRASTQNPPEQPHATFAEAANHLQWLSGKLPQLVKLLTFHGLKERPVRFESQLHVLVPHDALNRFRMNAQQGQPRPTGVPQSVKINSLIPLVTDLQTARIF